MHTCIVMLMLITITHCFKACHILVTHVFNLFFCAGRSAILLNIVYLMKQ